MGDKDVTTYILIAAVIVLVMGAGIVLYLVRDRLLGEDGAEMPGQGGILETMRGMRDRGEISEEEYRTAQAALVAKASGERNGGTGVKAPGPTRARTIATKPGERRAAPGFDLTGEPLPPAVLEETDRSAGESG